MKDSNIIPWWIIVMVWALSVSAHASEMMILTVEEPPGNFTDETGDISGLSVDYVREIQRRMGSTSPILMVPAARLLKTVFSQSNVAAFSVARTPEREDKANWITLVMRKPWALYAKKGSGLRINSLEDAKKVNAIGVLRDGIREDWLKQQGFKNLIEASEHEKNIKLLMREKVSLIFYSPHGAAHLCRKLGYDFNELEPVLFPHASLSYIVMSKNGTPPETVKLWQETAQQIKNDGTFERLAEKWAKYALEKNGIQAEVKDGALNFWKE